MAAGVDRGGENELNSQTLTPHPTGVGFFFKKLKSSRGDFGFLKGVRSPLRGLLALTPSPSPTGAGEGSVELSVEALPSDQRLCSATCSVRTATSAEGALY